jgi:parallel beta-helix repeat protein
MENEKTQCILLNNTIEFTSLDEALESAEAGDELILCKGSYVGGIYINTSITLKGNNPKDVILYPSKNESFVLMINAKNCHIKSFTISNNKPEDSSRFIKGIEVNNDNCNISKMIIDKCTYGIYCKEESSNHIITQNQISNNENGIECYHSSNNHILNNTFTDNSQFGLLLFEYSISNTIEGNVFNNNNEGIRLKGFDVKDNIIRNNQFSNNEEAIHECCGAQDNIIVNNEIN